MTFIVFGVLMVGIAYLLRVWSEDALMEGDPAAQMYAVGEFVAVFIAALFIIIGGSALYAS